jgi:hypothetical protein
MTDFCAPIAIQPKFRDGKGNELSAIGTKIVGIIFAPGKINKIRLAQNIEPPGS